MTSGQKAHKAVDGSKVTVYQLLASEAYDHADAMNAGSEGS